VLKLIERLGGGRNLKVCYEAGPTGGALHWQLTKLGIDCEVAVCVSLMRAGPGHIHGGGRDVQTLPSADRDDGLLRLRAV